MSRNRGGRSPSGLPARFARVGRVLGDDRRQTGAAAPSEVRNLLAANAETLSWSAPSARVSALYDSIRSRAAVDFDAYGVCVETADTSLSGLGRVLYYLVRAENACPAGTGPLGFRCSGQPIIGRACP